MADTVYKRRLGDRKEGRLVRSFPAYNKFTPFIMKTRNDANNLFKDKVEVTSIDRWLREKRREGYKGIGMLHLIIAAYIRVVAHRPALNRFVSGQKIYARHEIEIMMTVKHSLTDNSEESTIKIKFAPTDTVFDVYNKINSAIDEIKASEGGNGTDKFAETVSKFPRVLINLAIKLISIGDYFGLLPQSVLDISPFHGSLYVTDLGSLGIPPVNHHLYNFGNIPLFLAFGAKHKELQLDVEGKIVEKKYVDFTVTSDERICDGFYMAQSFKYLKYYLRNPQMLEVPPEKVEQDIF